MKKLLFIYNPKAGKALIKEKIGEIVEILSEKYEITIIPTKKVKDAIEIAKNRETKYDLIVCAGGDGTLDEVVKGISLSNFNTPIGYIPCGSTNDVSNSIGLSKDIITATKDILYGEECLYDYGTFNDNIFVYVAAFGLFTDVTYDTNQDLKNALGHFAYVLEGAKRLSDIKSYHMKITYDGKTIEDDFILGIISSSKSIGGFKVLEMLPNQNIQLDDGLFEVTLIKLPKNIQELNNAILYLTNINKTYENSSLYSFSTSKLTIESKEYIPWTLDGEFGGNHQKIEIKNKNKGLKLIHYKD